MNNSEFCRDIDRELSSWCDHLQSSISKFDQVPSIDKYKLTDHIGGLNILLVELQDKISELRTTCPLGQVPSSERLSDDIVGEPRYLYKESSGVHYDYDFGG